MTVKLPGSIEPVEPHYFVRMAAEQRGLRIDRDLVVRVWVRRGL